MVQIPGSPNHHDAADDDNAPPRRARYASTPKAGPQSPAPQRPALAAAPPGRTEFAPAWADAQCAPLQVLKRNSLRLISPQK